MRVLLRRPFFVAGYKLFEVDSRGTEIPEELRKRLPRDARLLGAKTAEAPPSAAVEGSEDPEISEPSPSKPMALGELAAAKAKTSEEILRSKAGAK